MLLDEGDRLLDGAYRQGANFRTVQDPAPVAAGEPAGLDPGVQEVAVPVAPGELAQARERLGSRSEVQRFRVETRHRLGAHAVQDIPFTQRNEEQGNVNGNDVRNGGAVYPIGSPVVAEVDYDGERKPDIFVSTSVGAIYGFEYEPETGVLGPKIGWPLHLPDVPESRFLPSWILMIRRSGQ